MDKSLEDNLCQAINDEDYNSVTLFLSQNANPNKTTSNGKTCLGEAATIGNIKILKLLVDSSKENVVSNKTTAQCSTSKKKSSRSHKRKRKQDGHGETKIKCKNYNERDNEFLLFSPTENVNTIESHCPVPDKNHGYYVFIYGEGPNSEEGKINSSCSPITPQELEWDEEIGNTAPPTSEDETWSSMYKWYASILESTGAAIASGTAFNNGLDQQDVFMRTALHYAAEQGNESAVNLLLDAGCKVDVIASDGLTPLHIAAVRNHIEIVQLLIKSGSQVNFKTHEKMTALHFASSRGYLDIVKVLINNGAYVDARDTNERTPLYLSAGRGHLDVVKFLISSGANVNGEEIHGYTPLCEAVWQKFKDVVEVLLSSGARITHSHNFLHNAVIQRQDDIIRMLVKAGGGINLHNDSGDTSLLLAVRLSQPNIAKILLENGANVNACNSITGATALHIAVENVICPKQFEELLICLIDHKIDMNTTALTGDTALNRALLIHNDFAAALLISYGADVNACDLHSCGLDNLSIASRRVSNALASMLIKAGHHTTVPVPNTKPPKPGTAAYCLYHVTKHPLSLSDLCRIKIRRMSGYVLYLYIKLLPLPKSLKNFLMLKDEGFLM